MQLIALKHKTKLNAEALTGRRSSLKCLLFWSPKNTNKKKMRVVINLTNSTNLLSSLSHLGVHRATSIQIFDFSTLYTSIPHDLLKSRMNSIINNAFKYKNGATRYTHIKVSRSKSYFTSDPLNGDNKYTANDICKMTEFLVYNIYVRFGGQLFRQTCGIPMGTNCAPLLADLFLRSYKNDKLIKEGKRKLARKFNLPYSYIEDLISFNNKRFKEFISDI